MMSKGKKTTKKTDKNQSRRQTRAIMGIEFPVPPMAKLRTFALLAGIGLLVTFGMVTGAIGYFQTNYSLFDTFFEVRVFAMSYINTLGFVIFTLTGIFGALLGFWYLRYIEQEL